MSYKVSLENFEGPFDLLLRLVARSELAIGKVSLTSIVDQYLKEVEVLDSLDLDTASDFLMVASSLLEIKAKALLPQETVEVEKLLVEQDPIKAREELVDKLLTYKQFKNAAEHLAHIEEKRLCKHTRQAGIPGQFASIMPDFLSKLRPEDLCEMALRLIGRQDYALLESDHIARVPLSVEEYARSIQKQVVLCKTCSFADLVGKNPQREVVVVNFLALLDLYKRGIVDLIQSSSLGDVSIVISDHCEAKPIHEY